MLFLCNFISNLLGMSACVKEDQIIIVSLKKLAFGQIADC